MGGDYRGADECENPVVVNVVVNPPEATPQAAANIKIS